MAKHQLFTDWVITEEEESKMQCGDLDSNIKLEEEIAREISQKNLRRSSRIAEKKKEKDVNDAYEAYVRSITPKQPR